MEGLLSLMSEKVESAVEYAASASIYSARTTIDEMTTAQTLVVSLFHGILYGDINFCSAILQLNVEQLQSSYLTVWLRDDFRFNGHDVERVMSMLSFLLNTSKLRIPVYVLWIFGSLVGKYGLADCCDEDLLAAFGDSSTCHSSAPRVKRSSLIQKVRLSLRRSPCTPQNVSKKKDDEFVIVTSDDCVDKTQNATPLRSPQPESKHTFNECNTQQAIQSNSSAKLVPTMCNEVQFNKVCCSEAVPQVLHDLGYVEDKRPSDKRSVKEVKVVYKEVDTLLHRNAEMGRTSAVRRLLDEGAHVDMQDRAGKTALHLAVQYNQVEVVRLLLKFKADVNVRCNEGRTPLSYAPFSKGGVSVNWSLISEAGGTI